MDKNYYQIDEVAQKTGLTKRAIRHYEEKGLIKPERTDAQYRLYSEEDVQKILSIKLYKQNLGFTLTEMKEVFELQELINAVINGDCKDTQTAVHIEQEIRQQVALIERKEAAMMKLKQGYLDVLDRITKITEKE